MRRTTTRRMLGIALLCTAIAIAEPATAPSAEHPYDAMARSFGVWLNPADPHAWPAKVRVIGRDEYHFWRGTRDLFFAWCRDHCSDWQTDRNAVVVSHGDLHLGNLGSYAAAPFGTVGYGLVDFDESARLPFQIDLLQGVITFELIARENKIEVSAADRARLHAALFDTYADAMVHPPADTGLAAMLPDDSGRAYASEVKQFTHAGRFKTLVTKGKRTTDLLRPVDAATRVGLAAALADAVQHDARLGALLRPYDAADFENCILDSAARTRVDSSGSQGLSKILVLLRRPFRDRDDDGLLYLKQQVPAAAERAGFTAPVPGPAARRYVRDLDALTHGRALAASWCELAGHSYWVSVKEPWSDEPDSKDIRDLDDLLAAARVWSCVVADSHRDVRERIRPLFTPATRTTIEERATAYLQWQATAFADFQNDARTKRIGE